MTAQPDLIPTPVSVNPEWSLCCPDPVNIYPLHDFDLRGNCRRCGKAMPRRVSPRKAREEKAP